ncbi:TIGR03089 family protein [Brachybacterium sp. J153]|uniref:TIGR03089 family protein n=1 Tax=Brachybacterium sp. J153 TaxID=3116488 RepID=UPI002E77679F|nr:TIGR03089 family protein [Brachybacterium sp. J153]MEE1616893.1 TIGR03089 family protein [Brachybacterium sp. J153]
MTPTTAASGRALLEALERSGPRPALAWYGEAARIELSGHVLANWVIKAIGHLHDEVGLEEGDLVVLDLPPHWKRLVLALAAWSLGAEVVVPPRGPAEAEDPRVVVTDRPDSDLAARADEVLALRPVSLAPRFDGELPALVRDWVLEVRGSSDRLAVTLPAWSGPAPAASTANTEDFAETPRLLVEGDGLEAVPALLHAWSAGGGIVAPAASVSDRQAADESVTGRG